MPTLSSACSNCLPVNFFKIDISSRPERLDIELGEVMVRKSNGENFFEGSGVIAKNPEANCGCFEPGPEKIQVEQVLGAEMAQKVIEFDMIVPDPKPDIEQVIDIYVKNVTEIMFRKLNIHFTIFTNVKIVATQLLLKSKSVAGILPKGTLMVFIMVFLFLLEFNVIIVVVA